MPSPFAALNIPVPPKPEDENARLPPIDVDLSQPDEVVSFQDGAKVTELPDGSAEIDLSGGSQKPKSDKFHANLAEHMDDAELNRIATEILEGIDRDDSSRSEHLEMIAEGMKLLGLVIESANASSTSSSAPLEGMSTVRHPLLLEACQLFQANALGELLPAAGPVKVRDDRPRSPVSSIVPPSPFTAPPVSPPPGVGAPGSGPAHPAAPGMLPNPQGAPVPPPPPAPPPPMPQGAPAPMPSAPSMPPPAPPGVPMPGMQAMGANGGPPLDLDNEEYRDELADALEKDFNHYLTVVDKGYVPDTDQMLFKIGFGGLGVKKVYNCPLKRMPIARSVNIEDFIVSKDVSDLADAQRITHRIKMAPSVLRRMQIAGAYRDIELGAPTIQSDASNQVDQAKAEIAGVQQSSDPRDIDYEILECYCELDLDEFAPKQFKGKKLPLPYKIVIERESRRVLELRRNWKENDEQCQAIEYFVDYPYMRAFGFYCIGLLHLLGNTTKALTALWREFIDAGMFANFPGFLYLKGAGRQLTNQFRVAPGSGIGLDSSVTDVRQAVMPLPYKSPDAAFTAFVTHVEQLGQRLGGSANQPTAEVRADAPVGTTLAIIEQASKPIGAVVKRLQNAQARELQLLKERFRADPEAFWRFNKRPAKEWEKAVFLKALETYDLVPVSDPNNPTRMHRQAKAEAYRQVVMSAAQLFDPKKAILKYTNEIGITGVEETFAPNGGQPQLPPVDPAKMADVAHKNEKLKADAIQAQQDSALDLEKLRMQLQNDAAERESKLLLAKSAENTERLRLASTIAIHSSDLQAAEKAANVKIASEHLKIAYGQAHDREMRHGDQQYKDRQSEVAHQRMRETAAEERERKMEQSKEKVDGKKA